MKKVSSEVAYDYIRKRILSGEYPSGHFLLTEAISVEIGVSRTPVREALHHLVADGLVTIRPRQGATVTRLDMKEFRELCGLRLALEGYATMMAALHHTPLELREIKVALDDMRTLTEHSIADDKDPAIHEGLIREDVRFHIAIMTSAKNDLVKSEILRLHLINRIVCGPAHASAGHAGEFTNKAEHDDNRRRVLASHDEIYDAIARRDPVTARNAMERHIQDIIDRAAIALSGTKAVARELTEEELVYSG
jgi:DNA-binding GntR family transcriptional regulator